MRLALLTNIKMALANLAAARLRTVLAMLGIVVGTASVVAMVSTGEMATEQALVQFKALGTDMMAVSISQERSQKSKSTAAENWNLAQALAVKTASPAIESLAPYTLLYAPVSYQGHSISANIIGATQALAQVIRIKIKAGRFVSGFDHYETYCIIGDKIAQELKSYNKEPLLTQIRIGEKFFTIMGIADSWPENAFFYQDINNAIIVPINTSSMLSKYANIDNLVFRVRPDTDIPSLQADITRYVSSVAPDKKLFFRSAKELVARMSAQRRVFTLLLAAIGSISLLVGGIGVMNIMLVSVLERRREIGIRLALGAHRSNIQWMFLNEAVLLSVVGGLIGIVTGIVSSLIIAYFAGWSFEFFLLPPLIGFVVSVLIGVFFGFYPARQASRLDPIQTLRGE